MFLNLHQAGQLVPCFFASEALPWLTTLGLCFSTLGNVVRGQYAAQSVLLPGVPCLALTPLFKTIFCLLSVLRTGCTRWSFPVPVAHCPVLMFAPSHFLQQFLVYVLLFFYGVNSSREGKEASCIFLLPTEYWKKVGLETT